MASGVAELILNLRGKDMVSGEVGKAKGSLGKLDKGLGTVRKGALLAGGAIVGVGGALVGGAFKMASMADEIDKTSKKMGVSTDALQEMRFWADQNGLSAQGLERAVGRLNQRIGLAADGTGKYAEAFEGLGVSIHGTDGQIRDTEDVMRDTISALMEIESSSERSAAASEIFGTKMARDLLPALEDGSLSLEEAAAKAHELGLVMDENAVGAGARFQDAWGRIRGAIGGTLQRALIPVMTFMADTVFPFIENQALPALGRFREQIGPLMERGIALFRDAAGNLIGVLQRMFTWFQDNILPALQRVGKAVREDLLPPLQRFTDWFRGNETAMKALGVAIGTVLVVAFGALAISAGAAAIAVIAATLPLLAIIAVIGGLAAALFVAWQRSETFQAVVTAVVNAVRDAVQSAIGFVIDKWNEWGDTIIAIADTTFRIMREVATFIGNVLAEIVGFVRTHWDTIWSVISGVLDTIKTVIEVHWFIFRDIIVETLLEIIGFVQTHWDTIEEIITTALGIIEDVITTSWDIITGIIDTAMFVIKDIIIPAFNLIHDTIGTVMGGIETIISGSWDTIKGIFNGVKGFITETVPGWFDSLRNGIGSALSGLAGIVRTPINAALGVVEGLVNGIARAINWVASKLGSSFRMDTISLQIGGGGGGGGPASREFVPGLASGTRNWRGGWAFVGERGPELMFVPRGAAVMPNRETMGLLEHHGVPGFQGGLNREAWLEEASGLVGGGVRGTLGSVARDIGGFVGDLPGVDRLTDAAVATLERMGSVIVDGIMAIPFVSDIANMISNGARWFWNRALSLLGISAPTLLGAGGLGGAAFNKASGFGLDKAREIWPFAEGGRIRAGTTAIVGERGPELFVPDRSGEIIPNRETMDTMRSLRDEPRGQGDVVLNIQHMDVHARDAREAERSVGDLGFAIRARGLA